MVFVFVAGVVAASLLLLVVVVGVSVVACLLQGGGVPCKINDLFCCVATLLLSLLLLRCAIVLL